MLWLGHEGKDDHLPAQCLGVVVKWASWAADLPRLRLLELRMGGCEEDSEDLDGTCLLCSVARAEGEGAEVMPGRLLRALGRLPLQVNDG